MWQRIQTVFLLIAVISLIASIFLPIWVMQQSSQYHTLYALHYSVTSAGEKTTLYFPYVVIGVLLVAAATVGIVMIQKYKDRMLQIKLGTLNALFLAGALAFAVYYASSMIKTHGGGEYGFGLWLPAVAVLCNWLAIRFIRKDEKLVRDSDRLR